MITQIRSRILTALLFDLVICSCCVPLRSATASVFDEFGTALIDFPSNGANIGQGVNMVSGLAADNICIVGSATTTNPGGPAPQLLGVHIRSTSDTSDFFEQTNVSAAAQAHFLYGEADAKTNYIATHNFSLSTSTLSVDETAEQREYIVPTGVIPVDAPTGPDKSASVGVQLSDQAVGWASDPDTFRKHCGDGFVAVLVSGGELVGTVTLLDTSSLNSSDLSTSLKVSGGLQAFGGSVTSTTDDTVQMITKGHKFVIDYIQSGGAGGQSAVSEKTFLDVVKNFPAAAHTAPMPYQILVRDYHTLSNFPKSAPPFPAPDTLDTIMTTYWRLNTVRQIAYDAQQSPPEFPLLPGLGNLNYFWLAGSAENLNSVRAVYDQLGQKRQTLVAQATACANGQKCSEPAVTPIELYSLAVQLPLPATAPLPSLLQFNDHVVRLQNMVNGFNAQKLRSYAYAISTFGTDGNCYYRDHFITQTFEAGGYPGNVTIVLNETRSFLASFPQMIRNDTIDFYARQPSQRRCGNSPTGVGCSLTETDFDKLDSVVPRVATKLVTDFEPDKTYRYGDCPGSITTTRLLHAAYVPE